MQASTARINKGNILIYRLFDVAEEIDIAEVERILQGTPHSGGKSRLKLAQHSRHQALVMRNPPLQLSLGESELKVGAEKWRADAYARVWDYGVVSILFQVPIPPGTAWEQLVDKASLVYGDIPGSEDIDSQARDRSRELSQILRTALKRPSERAIYEDYVIYMFEEIEGLQRGQDLLKIADVPALILGEKQALGDKSRGGILDNVYQYAANDLVVIDWNSAIVLEPSGNRDIADVLEFSVSHLLEFRYYDEMLDTRLNELYDAIERQRSGIWRSAFAGISKEANSRYIEFSEFLERVDNSLKVVGDFYLAKIFRAAVRRFRIPDWQQSITRKMNLLARVSELLQGEVNVYRGHTLELIIILLILFEIVSAVFKNM